MLPIILNLLNSEKAVASGVLVVASSVMVATGQITPEQWMQYTQMLLGIYVGGKTAQGAVAAITGRSQSDEARKAKAREKAAKAELKELKKSLSGNDSAADLALGKKFGDGLAEPDLDDDDVPPDEAPTDPGKRIAGGGEE